MDPRRVAILAQRAGRGCPAARAAAFNSLEDALATGGIDAVDAMLPHRLHEPVALRVLRAGKHLLLEKPMSTSLAACEHMLAAARGAWSPASAC